MTLVLAGITLLYFVWSLVVVLATGTSIWVFGVVLILALWSLALFGEGAMERIRQFSELVK